MWKGEDCGVAGADLIDAHTRQPCPFQQLPAAVVVAFCVKVQLSRECLRIHELKEARREVRNTGGRREFTLLPVVQISAISSDSKVLARDFAVSLVVASVLQTVDHELVVPVFASFSDGHASLRLCCPHGWMESVGPLRHTCVCQPHHTSLAPWVRYRLIKGGPSPTQRHRRSVPIAVAVIADTCFSVRSCIAMTCPTDLVCVNFRFS